MFQFVFRLSFFLLVALGFQIGATGHVHAQAQWIIATQISELEAEIDKCDRKIEDLHHLTDAMRAGISMGEESIVPWEGIVSPDSTLTHEEGYAQLELNDEIAEEIESLRSRINEAYSDINDLRDKKIGLRDQLNALKIEQDKIRPILEIPEKKKVKKLKKRVKKFRIQVEILDGKVKKIESDISDLRNRKIVPREKVENDKVVKRINNNPIWFIEGGAGVTSPLNSPDLDPFNQFIDNSAGPNVRVVGGVIWPNAIGNMHLGVGIAAIGARTVPGKVGNKLIPGVLNTGGQRDYFGVLPSLWVEIPVFDRTNLRLGGGLGLVKQEFGLNAGGVSVARASGTTLAGQIGGGLRFMGGPNWDVGIDTYATHIGSISGRTNTNIPFRLGGQWDLLTTISFRYQFGGPSLFKQSSPSR